MVENAISQYPLTCGREHRYFSLDRKTVVSNSRANGDRSAIGRLYHSVTFMSMMTIMHYREC
jgi:hypothetical protein